jgi:hypothetical protein
MGATFAERFGTVEVQFGPARFTVRGLTVAEREWVLAQAAAFAEATRKIKGDQLVVRLGCVGWDVRWNDGEALSFDRQELQVPGATLRLVRAELVAQLPAAVLEALSFRIGQLTRLSPAELESLGFLSLQTPPPEAAPGAGTADGAAPVGEA